MTFNHDMESRLPSTIGMPEEIKQLFQWMEDNSFLQPSERYQDDMLGLLGTTDDLEAGEIPAVLFRIATAEQIRDNFRYWFGYNVPNIEKRLVPLARVASDGSEACFWLDDNGRTQIVYIGSEGEAFVLGQTPLDFLLLLGVGHHEIDENLLSTDLSRQPVKTSNRAFRTWLKTQFQVAPPENALEIIAGSLEPPYNGDQISRYQQNDPFRLWCDQITSQR